MRTLNHLMDQLVSSAVGPRKVPLVAEFGIRYAADAVGGDQRGPSRHSQGGESLSNGETSPTRQSSIAGASHGFDGAGCDDSVAPARAERLRQIRAQIEAGVYDTPEKFEAAIDRLYDVLQNDLEPR